MIACLAHNLLRWTELIGLPGGAIRAARTVRRRLLALPGRLTTHAGRWTLHLPARWPWQTDFTEALGRIRALPPPPDRAPAPASSTSTPDAPAGAISAARRRAPNDSAGRLHGSHAATTRRIARSRPPTRHDNREQPTAERPAVD